MIAGRETGEGLYCVAEIFQKSNLPFLFFNGV